MTDRELIELAAEREIYATAMFRMKAEIEAKVKQIDDLDHAKAVVRSFGYSIVTSKFIERFSEFVSDWKKGDFDLPTLATLDLESCFVAWQEMFHEMEEGDPVAKIESLKADAERYRWWIEIVVSGDFKQLEKAFCIDIDCPTKEIIDAAIDVARKGTL